MQTSGTMWSGACVLVLALALWCSPASGATLASLRGGGRGEGGYEPSTVDGYDAANTTRIQSVPGPSVTAGDAAWRKRREELSSRRPGLYEKGGRDTNEDGTALAAAAPLTALYAMARNHKRLFPGGAVPNPLRVHVLGAAYTFEGRGDWQLLGEAMPPGVSLEVSLVVGARLEADGVPQMEGVRSFKERVCRERGTTRVRCIEAYHQDVMEKMQKPHFAIMFNPGFPTMLRRTWDKSLLFLLRNKIPTAVSSQVTSDNRWPKAGESWNPRWVQPANEDFAIHSTIAAYGADVWSTTGSPFFLKAKRRDGNIFIKNAVIEVFRGYRRGVAPPHVPAALPREEVEFLNNFDWRRAERKCRDYNMRDGLRQALLAPVSDAFERAADTVYLRILQYAAGLGWWRDTGVPRRVKSLMQRMKRKERVTARDWMYLKVELGLS